MLPSNSDPSDLKCPKCGTDMEPIDSTPDGPLLQQLQLCPNCYLVMWNDKDGMHVRQGVPMKPGFDPGEEPPGWVAPEPEKC